jgi:hypothetical protein
MLKQIPSRVPVERRDGLATGNGEKGAALGLRGREGEGGGRTPSEPGGTVRGGRWVFTHLAGTWTPLLEWPAAVGFGGRR